MIIQKKLNHGGPRDIYIRPVSGGEPINLTASWDLDPGDTQWSPDSRFLYFTAGIGGENHLFRIHVPEGKVEQMTKGPRRLNGISFDRAMARIAYTVGVHEAPGDVYVANIDGTGERRLTDIHKEVVSEIAFSKAERLRWPSYDGTEIEGWLMFPHGYDPAKGPYPLIVTSHGGPHSATGYSFDFKDQYFAANGYFVFDTNFRSSTGYGDKFKWATWGEWGKKDGEDVVSGIDYVLKKYPDRCQARRAHRPFVRRVHDQLADYPVPRSVCGRHLWRRYLELDQRLRHGRHLQDQGNRILRHTLGTGSA